MIRIQCDELCPGDCSNNWSYNDSGWKEDSDIEIACANSKGINLPVYAIHYISNSMVIILCFLYLKDNFSFSNNLRVVEVHFVVIQVGSSMI